MREIAPPAMTETPPSFAEARTGLPAADVLSEMLRAVRLTGSVFFDGRFTAPFGVISPPRWDAGTPMAHLKHASVFHLLTSGRCWIELGDIRRELSAGDLVLLPFTSAHKFWCGEPGDFIGAEEIVQDGPLEGVSVARYGGAGEETRFICGYLESSELLAAPVFRDLPPLLVERTDGDPVTSKLARTAGEIVDLLETAQPGVQALLGRMMELLFVEVLRRHAARLPEGATGWLAALNDAVVARALAAMHADPARRWSIEALAKEAGASRTVLNERFHALLGKPPIEYLAAWRIQLAAEALAQGDGGVAQIAQRVGYDSEAAFSRAFKRAMGLSPSAWRAQRGA